MSLSAGVHGYLSWPSLPQKQTFFITQPHPSLTIILHRQPSRLTSSIMFYTYNGLFTLYYISWMVPVRLFTSISVLSLPTQCLLLKHSHTYPTHICHTFILFSWLSSPTSFLKAGSSTSTCARARRACKCFGLPSQRFGPSRQRWSGLLPFIHYTRSVSCVVLSRPCGTAQPPAIEKAGCMPC